MSSQPRLQETTRAMTSFDQSIKSLQNPLSKVVLKSPIKSPPLTHEQTQRIRKKNTKLILKDFIQPFVPGSSLKITGQQVLDETTPTKEMPSTVFQKQAPDSPSLVSNDNNSVTRDGGSDSRI